MHDSVYVMLCKGFRDGADIAHILFNQRPPLHGMAMAPRLIAQICENTVFVSATSRAAQHGLSPGGVGRAEAKPFCLRRTFA